MYATEIATGALSLVSVDGMGRPSAPGSSFTPQISADGRFVVFTSVANLDRDDTPAARSSEHSSRITNVYVRDLHEQVTRRVSRGVQGRAANGPSCAPVISAEGRLVAFVSSATNLVEGAGRFVGPNVYLRDLLTSTTTLISRSARGGAANGRSAAPAMSANGHIIAFASDASDLICATHCAPQDRDINLLWDVFVFDLDSGSLRRISADPDAELDGTESRTCARSGWTAGRLLVAASDRHVRHGQ